MQIQQKKFQTKRDNYTIRGLAYLPEGEDLPIAIVCHGFLSNYETTKHYARQFAEWGYAAFCFDFVGGGIGCHSDGRFRDMSVLTEKADLLAVIDYVKSLSCTKSSDITLMGCSQGGFVSALTAAERKEAISRLILFFPAFCIPDDARSGKMMMFQFDPENIPDKISAGPLTLGGEYARCVVNMDPYQEIAGYTGPVLIVHGDCDRIVNLRYSRQAQETYGEACRLKVIENADHGFQKAEDAIAIDAVREFLGIEK